MCFSYNYDSRVILFRPLECLVCLFVTTITKHLYNIFSAKSSKSSIRLISNNSIGLLIGVRTIYISYNN